MAYPLSERRDHGEVDDDDKEKEPIGTSYVEKKREIVESVPVVGPWLNRSGERQAQLDAITAQKAAEGSVVHKAIGAVDKGIDAVQQTLALPFTVTASLFDVHPEALSDALYVLPLLSKGASGLAKTQTAHNVAFQAGRTLNRFQPVNKRVVDVKSMRGNQIPSTGRTSAFLRRDGLTNPTGKAATEAKIQVEINKALRGEQSSVLLSTRPIADKGAIRDLLKPLKGPAKDLNIKLTDIRNQSQITTKPELQSPQLANIPKADLDKFAIEAIQNRAGLLKLKKGTDKYISKLASISGLGKNLPAYGASEKVKLASDLQREYGTADRSALTHVSGMPFMNQHHEWMKKAQSMHVNRAWELVEQGKATVQDVLNLALLADDAGMGTGDYGTIGAPKVTHDMTHQDFIKKGTQYDTTPWTSSIQKTKPQNIQPETWKAAKVAAKEINVKGVTKDDLEYIENWGSLEQGLTKWKKFRLSKHYKTGDNLSEMDREGIRVNKIDNINDLTKDFIIERDRLPAPMKEVMDRRTDLWNRVIENKDKLTYFKLRNLRKNLKAEEALLKKSNKEVPETLTKRIEQVKNDIEVVKEKMSNELLQAEERQLGHLENLQDLTIDKLQRQNPVQAAVQPTQIVHKLDMSNFIDRMIQREGAEIERRRAINAENRSDTGRPLRNITPTDTRPTVDLQDVL